MSGGRFFYTNQTREQKNMSESGRRDDGRRLWPAVCVDVETLDTRPTARILEIGVVCFDPETGEMGPSFQMELCGKGQERRSMDEGTLRWWMAREREGMRMPGKAEDVPGHGLTAAYLELVAFMATHTDPAKVQAWAWGMDFDFPILKDAYGDHGWWRYHNQRCARTLCGEMGILREGEVAHRALADARQEAEAVMEAIAKVEAVDFLAKGFFPDDDSDEEDHFGRLLAFAKGTDELLGGLAARGDLAGGIADEADGHLGGAGALKDDGGDVGEVDPGLAGDAGAGVVVAGVGDEEEAREFHGLLGMMRQFEESDSARFSSSVLSWCDGKPERMAAFRRMAGRRLEIKRAGVRLSFENGLIVCEDA